MNRKLRDLGKCEFNTKWAHISLASEGAAYYLACYNHSTVGVSHVTVHQPIRKIGTSRLLIVRDKCWFVTQITLVGGCVSRGLLVPEFPADVYRRCKHFNKKSHSLDIRLKEKTNIFRLNSFCMSKDLSFFDSSYTLFNIWSDPQSKMTFFVLVLFLFQVKETNLTEQKTNDLIL